MVEWGPGIYGDSSACRYYDETAARNIGGQQAARLAAILPAPLKRRPERMNKYSAIILERMRQMGWYCKPTHTSCRFWHIYSGFFGTTTYWNYDV